MWSTGPIRALLQSKKTVPLSLILVSHLLKKYIFWKRWKCYNQIKQHKIFSTTLIKGNIGIFVECTITSLKKCIEHPAFTSKLKLANITTVHKKTQKFQKTITDLSVFYQLSLKYMKKSCLNNCLSYQAMSSTRTQSQLCTATPVSLFVQCQVHFDCSLRQSPRLFQWKYSWGNHMSIWV